MTDYAVPQNPDGRSLPPSAAAHLMAHLARAIGALKIWNERSRQRSELIELPPHLLFDIGLTRGDVEQEARKRPWQGSSLPTRNRFTREQ